MLIIGLTGSIGMGKSTAAKRLAANGLAVFDADAEVHRLYAGEAAPLIEAAFPGTVKDGAVDRARLAAAVVGNKEAMARLEAIIHPLVRQAERRFLQNEERRGAEMAVLEIPLLFETGADAQVDVTLVVSSPAAVQRERVLERAGMDTEKLDRLLANQMPDLEKRARADFVVDTSGPIEETGAEIDRIIESLRGREGTAWRKWQAGE
jgi:dephospho-CoA kinase